MGGNLMYRTQVRVVPLRRGDVAMTEDFFPDGFGFAKLCE